ncbi:hypothetical protein HD806DRAFT_528590 [Xylariaceae sp. AK1471]|nr:hypothetical protein HD806DRAFT_528590 [Xylariaceae sp. AK1471]
MSALYRACACLNGIGTLHRLSAVTQKATTRTIPRGISWMAFEQPDPALYPPPPSLQPKRPVTVATAKAVVPGTNTTTPPVAIAGIGSVPSTSTTSTTAASSTTQQEVPPSIPVSAMQTGPSPLSQIQKRTFATTQHQMGASVSGFQALVPFGRTQTQQCQGVTTKRHMHHSPSMHIRVPEHPDQPRVHKIKIQEFTGFADHVLKIKELEQKLSKLPDSYEKRQGSTILYILEYKFEKLEAELNELNERGYLNEF